MARGTLLTDASDLHKSADVFTALTDLRSGQEALNRRDFEIRSFIMLPKSLLGTAALISIVLVNFVESGDRPREATYEFTYSVRVTDLPQTATQVDLWVPVPSDSQGQKVIGVKVIQPNDGEIGTEPRYQNRMFHKRFLGPFQKAPALTAELVFRVGRSEVIIPEAKALAQTGCSKKPHTLDVYLRPNRLIPIDG